MGKKFTTKGKVLSPKFGLFVCYYPDPMNVKESTGSDYGFRRTQKTASQTNCLKKTKIHKL